jgi:hypothetical protein
MTAAQLLTMTLKHSQSVNSYTAALTITTSAIPGSKTLGDGGLTLSGDYSEQLRPSQLREFNATTVQAAQLPIGPLDEITTPTALYVKMPAIRTLLNSSKPWIEIPRSDLTSGSGAGLAQLLGEAQSGDPLSDAQLLAGAKDTRTVGTSTLNGVPVTEITGSEPTATALANLPASLRSSLSPAVQKLGIKQITFQGWVDGQRNFRKLILHETGGSMSETVTMTVTSIDKSVSISVPAASEAQTLPASALRGGSGL